MKKILCLSLAVMLAISLSACTDSEREEQIASGDYIVYEGNRLEQIAHSVHGDSSETIFVDVNTNIIYIYRFGAAGYTFSSVLYNQDGQPMTKEEFLSEGAE